MTLMEEYIKVIKVNRVDKFCALIKILDKRDKYCSIKYPCYGRCEQVEVEVFLSRNFK